ncbi:hypothetical protein PEDI_34090 [Persicobacter diffluens]|uniref:YbaK/aminoacyl-tRNA synthetase-associated domain-containing protein n=1 Tax=Persicobacter diffluens TaxID=981 RepID=A0AAN4W0G5_9BACT|nr:hypothetical protein PEDI_34090 [Persicobacter diffluens]
MVPMKEVLPLIGYIRGGCSPLGMKKNYPTFFDQAILDLDTVNISAGL